MKLNKEQKQAFRTFFHKGPVAYETSQRAAQNAYYKIKHLLTTSEKSKLGIAQGHALIVGEGRQEFDSICKEIGKRLNLELI